MEQKYLPIGSVCTLKGKSRKVMITGYYAIKFNGNLKINDYKGCVYPEGLLISDQTISFDHSDIENIDFVGFKNAEQEKFMNLFNKLTGNISEEEKAADFHAKNDMVLTSSEAYSKLLFDENGVVMIAEPVEEKKEEKANYTFDENGTVISISGNNDVNNPFYQQYTETAVKEKDPNDWEIFGNIEFDENGVVVADNTQKKDESLSEIQFDENGVVISVGGEDLKPKKDYSKYKFDKNGTLIAIEDDDSEPQKVQYEFDENGVVVADKKENKPEYKFDESGTVISE